MRIAFVYIAEAYQAFHGAGIAIGLARQPGVEIFNFHADPDTPRQLRRIHAAFGAPPPVTVRLHESVTTRALRGARYLGAFKERLLRDNRETLDSFDAIVSVENTLAFARDVGIERPRLIYSPHGFGDRAYAFVARITAFDFVLLAGAKTEAQMLERGLIRPGHYALTGSVKLETATRLAAVEALPFAKAGPTALYNPHFDPKLTSWTRFIAPLLAEYATVEDRNLIAAPHVKWFRRSAETTRRRWRDRSTGNVLVDPGSDRSVDGSYLSAADLYIGDSSSQVYEFLATPRPCLFLNAHGVDWRDSPNHAHWHLGDVIERPEQLADAIRAAPERHALYNERQEAARLATFGDGAQSASVRSAAAIYDFLRSAR